MISFSSAFEFDNVEYYDEDTRTFTIKNCNVWLVTCLIPGDTLVTAQLTTPYNVMVARGEDRLVGEFTFQTSDNLLDVFGELYLEDLKNGNTLSRGQQYKYKTYKEISVDDYETVCQEVQDINGTIYTECEEIEIGSHLETQMDWIPISKPGNVFIQNTIYEIGIFVDVEKGDRGDWIPQFYNMIVEQWSQWTESLNVDLISYYKFDEPSGTTAFDSLGLNNLTNTDAIVDQSLAIINKSYLYDGTGDYVENAGSSNVPDANEDRTFCTWVFPTVASDDYLWNIGGVAIAYIIGEKFLGVGFPGGDLETVNIYPVDNWIFFCMTHDSGNTTFYVNGTLDVSRGITFAFDTDLILYGNHIANRALGIHGNIDEAAIWNRSLSSAEIVQLYNGGDGITFTDTFGGITTTLNAPSNDTLQSSTLVEFNWTIIPIGVNATNWTFSVFFDNGTLLLQEINTTINTNETFVVLHNETITDGNYIWKVESCADDDSCDLSDNRTFSIDTINPLVNITSPPDGFVVTQFNQSIDLNWTVTDVHPGSCWYTLSTNVSNNVFVTCSDNTTIINYPITNPDNLTIDFFSNDTLGNLGSDNVTIFKSQVSPIINITSPVSSFSTIVVGQLIDLNFTVTNSTSLDVCVFSYNSINTTINCITENQTNFTYVSGVNNITVFVNDTLSNFNSTTRSWTVTIIEINQTFDNETLEGSTQDISAIINLAGGESISAVILSYNGTSSTGTTSTVGGNVEVLRSGFVTPGVNVETNITFQWSIVLSGGAIINLTQQNQTILKIGIDNCSTFTNKILNLTMVDEREQTLISIGTEVEVAINIFSSDRSSEVIDFSEQFDNVNPIGICLDVNISGGISYSLDSIIRYTATDYANEYYNIINFTLNNNSGTQNITLFDLNITDSTDFQLVFTGEDFLPVENALVLVERQYISENVFKTVELPKTDSNGQTILHLVRNDVIYNIVVIKGGVVLGNFANVIAFCQDFTIGACSLALNAISNTSLVFNYDDEIGLIFQENTQYNETTGIASFSFASTSGTARIVNMRIERRDVFGNRTICENTLVSSSGSVSCQVDLSLEDTTLLSIISVDGEERIYSEIILDGTAYGQNGYSIFFIFAIAMVLMFSGSKTWTLVGVSLNYIVGVSMGLIVGGIAGLGSTGIFILIITMVGIWQLNKERKQ